MKTVKQRPTGKKRTLSRRLIRVPPKLIRKRIERARASYQQQADQEQQERYRSPEEYALSKTAEAASKTVRGTKDAVQGTRTIIRQRTYRIKEKDSDPYRDASSSAPNPSTDPAQTAAKQNAARRFRHIRNTSNATEPANETVVGTRDKPRPPTQRSEKPSKPLPHAQSKSSPTTKAGQPATMTAAASTQRTPKKSQAAKATAKVTESVRKTAAAIAKAVTAATKSVSVWIAAGGGVILLIFLAVAAISALLTSAFGILFSDEADPGALKQTIVDVNTAFTSDLQAQIDSLSTGGYDAVNVIYEGDFDGDSLMVNNWTDVLAVYAVLVTTDAENGDEVLTMTPEKRERLAATFNDMNIVDIRTDTTTSTTTTIVDGEEVEETTVTLNIHIHIRSLDYLEGAQLYAFDDNQLELLNELMSPEYFSLFAELINVDLYGGLTAGDIATLVGDLPAGSKGGTIAQAAISKVGTPYSMMDCSDLSQYAYAQAGVSIPGTSVEQARYCYNNGYSISAASLQPGDLIFWSKPSCTCGRWNEIHHVAVFVGNGRIVDGSSSKGRVVLRDIWDGSTWRIVMYARPHV